MQHIDGADNRYTKDCTTTDPIGGHASLSKLESSKGGALILPRHLQPLPPPPVATPLEEDSYIAGVSAIIERDFFPGLSKLRVQNDLLDAVHNADYGHANALRRQLAQLSGITSAHGSHGLPVLDTPMAESLSNSFLSTTPEVVHSNSTPRISKTSLSTTVDCFNQPTESDISNDPPPLNTSVTLDVFQAKYTSQDNASFLSILDRQNEANKERYHWMYDKEKKTLMLENTSNESDLVHAASAVTASGVEMLLEAPEHISKPIEGWNYKAKNALMYGPESVPLTLADLSESRGQPKSISHSATRFPTPTNSISGQLQSNMSSSQQPNTQQVWSHMAKATPGLFHGVAGAPSDSPRVSGFGFVPATPTLLPNEDIDPSDLMTWGMIQGTPLLVDSGMDHSNGPAFKMPATPRREILSMRLSNNASKALKKRSDIALGSGGSGLDTPKSTTPLLASPLVQAGSPMSLARVRALTPSRQRQLSPAAMQLLANTSLRGSPASGLRRSGHRSGGGGLDAQLRASYSGPLLSPRPSSTRRTLTHTPSSSSQTPTAHSATSKSERIKQK
ncbi:hypothetical protein BASA50_002575 [Batrachochytrium salamandrivorans]|uniref:Protein DGCR14 n=1 Tax=Batrachochytrium salamandrivorans TaxID=1357716 RepID=A0ABQ8FKY6_9FUNG|nr:hypothetical protein BASA61_010544 [Batrachochytrium salamandrivorans]KAH6600116.1 hypothetical protein BASA50_002575 [Batrachochytrium salamandrivorans]KAH9250233.1 hypothetical protein BASA81_011976 [Batrachochytrium salamandrivorans]